MIDVFVTIGSCIFGFLIHAGGLTLLHIRHDMHIYGTQKWLITALSVAEMSFLVVTAVRDYVFYRDDFSDYIGTFASNYKTIVSTHLYYFTMFGITIDRFLQIRLNIKYQLYCNTKSTKKVLITIFIILHLLYLTYLLVALAYQQYELSLKVLINFHKYVTPIYYFSFTITACAVYFYIFSKIYKNQKAHERCQKSLRNRTESTNRKLSNIKYLIPFWIIVTFILFQVLPDIMLTIYLLKLLPNRKTFTTIIIVLFRFGYLADPIIYIYNLRIVKRRMRKIKASISSHFLKC